MNYIKRLETELAQAQATIASFKAQCAQYSAFLCGPKFTGTENGQRKDWVSTTDVLYWLREMQSTAEQAGENLNEIHWQDKPVIRWQDKTNE